MIYLENLKRRLLTKPLDDETYLHILDNIDSKLKDLENEGFDIAHAQSKFFSFRYYFTEILTQRKKT